jgi:hypothetical protein
VAVDLIPDLRREAHQGGREGRGSCHLLMEVVVVSYENRSGDLEGWRGRQQGD